MSDDTAIFTGSVTTTGRSAALRIEKSFFRANPEFRQRAKVTARVVGPGPVLAAVDDLRLEAAEPDPVVTAFLAFLERDMIREPSRLTSLPEGAGDALARLLEGVVVSDDELIPEDIAF